MISRIAATDVLLALRRHAVRQGYVVDEGFDVEDWRPITGKMMRS